MIKDVRSEIKTQQEQETKLINGIEWVFKGIPLVSLNGGRAHREFYFPIETTSRVKTSNTHKWMSLNYVSTQDEFWQSTTCLFVGGG